MIIKVPAAEQAGPSPAPYILEYENTVITTVSAFSQWIISIFYLKVRMKSK